MGRNAATAAGNCFAEMLEQRIGDGAPRPSHETRRPPLDEAAGPTWDWLSTAALDASRWADLGAASLYEGAAADPGRTSPPVDPAPRPDAFAGLTHAQRAAMGFFHDLGEVQLHPGSNARALKGAYRRLARRLHPDVGASAVGAIRPDTGAFIELRRNYEVLSGRLAA